MVEMAVCLPVFLLLVFGVFTIGTIYNHQFALNTSAREGARLGAVGHSDTTITEHVKSMTPNLHQDRLEVLIDRDTTRVAVNITYYEQVHVPVLSILFNNKKLVARAEHRFETEWIER